MRQVLLVLGIIFIFCGDAYAGRTGLQFESGGNLGVVHYGDDYGWTVGGSVGFDELSLDINGVKDEIDGDSLRWLIFARKNLKIEENTYFGLGVWSSWKKKEGEFRGFEIKADTWSIAPYFIFDYHLNEHFLLNAGVSVVTFSNTDYEFEDQEIATQDEISYFSPFFSATYLF